MPRLFLNLRRSSSSRSPAVVQPVEKPVAEPRARASKAASAAAASGDSSIRVSIEKVDQLINLVGELVITQAMLLQTATQMQESARSGW
jgi:two-component system chemotaxis sensor kinase CheA